jgi:hypothetical protein
LSVLIFDWTSFHCRSDWMAYHLCEWSCDMLPVWTSFHIRCDWMASLLWQCDYFSCVLYNHWWDSSVAIIRGGHSISVANSLLFIRVFPFMNSGF